MARRTMAARRRTRAARRPPSFFKVLVEDDFSDQLEIPPAFYKHFDGKVPRQSLLQTPIRAWNVDVKKVNDRLIFQKGWKKFAHDSGLNMGEFLVFHYAGKFEFVVEIFGTNACKRGSLMGVGQSERPLDEEGQGNEIHNPRSKHVGSSSRHGKHNVDDEAGSCAAGTKTRKATTPIKKVIVLDSESSDSETSESQTSLHFDEPETDQLSEDSEIGLPSTDRPLDEEGRHGNENHRKCPSSKHAGSSSRHGKQNADNQGLKGSSTDGTRTRQPTSPIKNVVVVIDESETSETSESEVSESETSEYEAFESEPEASETETDQLSGDSEIGLPNGYDQLGSGKKLSSKAQVANSSTSQARALEAAQKHSSKYPYFTYVLKHGSVHKGLLHVPKIFMNQLGRRDNIKLQVSKKLWPIKCVHDSCSTRLSGGWFSFVSKHALKVGDVCVFELIKRDDAVIKVSIFRC